TVGAVAAGTYDKPTRKQVVNALDQSLHVAAEITAGTDFGSIPIAEVSQCGWQVVLVGHGRPAHEHGDYRDVPPKGRLNLQTHKVARVVEPSFPPVVAGVQPLVTDHG